MSSPFFVPHLSVTGEDFEEAGATRQKEPESLNDHVE